MGFSIDKMLFKPGHYIPSNLLAWCDGERSGEDCPEISPRPAEVFGEVDISDHKPVQLLIPCEKPEQPRRTRRLQLEEVTEGQWGEMDATLAARLAEAEPQLSRDYESGSASHFYVRFERILLDMLEPMYRVASTGADRDLLAACIADAPFIHKSENSRKRLQSGTGKRRIRISTKSALVDGETSSEEPLGRTQEPSLRTWQGLGAGSRRGSHRRRQCNCWSTARLSLELRQNVRH